MTDCIFCRIAAGEIPAEVIFDDGEILAFRDVNPQAPTHILVIPRRHISTLLEAGESDAEILGRLQLTAIDLARQEGLEERGFRLVTNCLEEAGQSVFHVHLHLLGGRPMGWPPG
ncbi:MAG TPA: histidine triad nucleotide-binding protein [Thermoanaerobaculia bacterium]|nr:histidine triad nucleotide-binding protein [Thermoanaerobaculia bacterium]